VTLSRRELLRRGRATALLTAVSPTLMQAAAREPNADAVPRHVHFLRRVSWGLRAGDVARLGAVGYEAYLEAQLHPATLPDPAVDALMAKNRVFSGDLNSLRHAADADYGGLLERALWLRLYRAVWSERQLYEKMVEFWTDHFNVPIPDLLVDKIIDDRDVVRVHALGRFDDLLRASAMSPAMLSYLDNASSAKEYPNENYARELLELHTLGVDGGYSERDVREVARAFTGWTLHEGYPGRFYFDPERHDTDEKHLLGRTLPAGRGIEDGLEVLDLLAHHPATARFIAFKLGRMFVQDDPPESFIASTAQVFNDSGGDIKTTLKHLFNTDTFWASAGRKYRRPMEHMAAMMRALYPALDVRAEGRGHFIWALEGLGHQPYSWFPPDGCPNTAAAWISTSGLLNRWNLAMLLPYASENWLEGVSLALDDHIPQAATVGAWLGHTSEQLRGLPLRGAERDALVQFVAGTTDPDYPLTPELRADKLAAVAGLFFASPQFGWS